MRRAEFDRLVEGEFGGSFGSWIADMHVLEGFGESSSTLIEQSSYATFGWRCVMISMCLRKGGWGRIFDLFFDASNQRIPL